MLKVNVYSRSNTRLLVKKHVACFQTHVSTSKERSMLSNPWSDLALRYSMLSNPWGQAFLDVQ